MSKTKETNVNPWANTVTLKLFRDSERYRDDVFAAVNGRRYRIQRGVEVTVPACVAAVIEESEKQDEKTAGLISEVSGKYNA